MRKLLLFGGTKEGRRLTEYLLNTPISLYVCVATEYGGDLLPKGENLTISTDRLDQEAMIRLMKQEQFDLVIDATHPFAVEATKQIRLASLECGLAYHRLLRDTGEVNAQNIGRTIDNVVTVASIKEAVAYLKNTNGNILVTTGSKELSCFCELPDAMERVYARVLSIPEVVTACAALGFVGEHLIAMQGPFSEELNFAMLKQTEADFLVTKASGAVGGFGEKLEAAKRAGVNVVVIGQCEQEEGFTYHEIVLMLDKDYGIRGKRKVAFIGIGMGGRKQLTLEAEQWFQDAELVVGAPRMLKDLDLSGKEIFHSYRSEEILEYLELHPEFVTCIVLFSGDIGFYSGAKKLLPLLSRYEVHCISGISSPVYFMNRLGRPWEDVKLLSLHGRKANVVNEVRSCPYLFALLGDGGVKSLCEKLVASDLKKVKMFVGEDLSYPEEKITIGTPEELIVQEFSPLSVVYIENEDAKHRIVTHGISDEEFQRGAVPMTKSEVRSISISKLELTPNSILYDIGAGTGSVSIEAAIQSSSGMVYAIEKKQEAVHLIKENIKKFGVENIEVVEGLAPECMKKLPVPSHAFIGGSSGNLKQIISDLIDRNPNIRIVANAIALETLSELIEVGKELPVERVEIVQASISKAKPLGSYQMMFGQNPVYIISFSGNGGEGYHNESE